MSELQLADLINSIDKINETLKGIHNELEKINNPLSNPAEVTDLIIGLIDEAGAETAEEIRLDAMHIAPHIINDALAVLLKQGVLGYNRASGKYHIKKDDVDTDADTEHAIKFTSGLSKRLLE